MEQAGRCRATIHHEVVGLLPMIVLFVGAAGIVMLYSLTHLRRPTERPASSDEEAFEAKVASISLGEQRAVEALVRIASSRTAPDRPRARAIRMLVEQAEPAIVSRVLRVASRLVGDRKARPRKLGRNFRIAELAIEAHQSPAGAAPQSSMQTRESPPPDSFSCPLQL